MDGSSAGILSWNPSTLADAVGPESLFYSPPSNVTTNDHYDFIPLDASVAEPKPRQIKSGSGEGARLTDITTQENKLTISFYEGSSVGDKANGLYTTTGAAKKTVTYETVSGGVIVNTTVSGVLTESQKLEQNLGTSSQTYSTTDLFTGRKESRTTAAVDGDKVNTVEVWQVTSGYADQLLSKKIDTYHTYTLSDNSEVEEQIRSVEDPDGANRITNYNYTVTDNAVTLTSETSTDGSWTFYPASPDPVRSNSTRVTYYPWKNGTLSSALIAPLASDRREEVEYYGGGHETYIAGILVKKSQTTNASGVSFESLTLDQETVDEWHGSGTSDKQTTITYTYNQDDATASHLRGKTYVRLMPDGSRVTYDYSPVIFNSTNGSYTVSTTTDSNALLTTQTNGTIASPAGIANVTTKTEAVEDKQGNTLLERTLVYTGSSYSLMTSTRHFYNGEHLTQSVRDGVTIYEASWTGDRKTSETDEYGTVTNFTYYPGTDRVQTETRLGSPDKVTTYVYDAEGRILSQTTTGDTLSQARSTTYTRTGETETETDEYGRTSTYSYSVASGGGRMTTVTQPGGLTTITETYRDGQTKSVTGTATIPTYYDYGTDGSYRQYTEVHAGSSNSSRTTRTTVDGLGRTISTREPAYSGGVRETVQSYNDQGQVASITRTGLGTTTRSYAHPYGQMTETLSAAVGSASDPDQVSTSTSTYTSSSGVAHVSNGWYRVNTVTRGTGTETSTVSSKSCLSGVAQDSLSVDAKGLVTATAVAVNRATKTVTTSSYAPSVSQPDVTVQVNGLLVSSRAASQSADTTYSYDDLDRLVTTTSPEGGNETRTYVGGTSLVETVTSQGQTTNYSYYPATHSNAGLVQTVTRPGGSTQTTTYNARGQVLAVTGTATYPLGYEYDSYGQLWKLKTYRNGAGATADTTTWTRQESTGLLTAKTDDKNKSVTYTYNDAGLLNTRTWARGSATTYAYNGAGQLHGVDYADSTPDVIYSYDSQGRPKTLNSPAMGTATYTYDPNSQVTDEAYSGAPLNGVLVHRGYASTSNRLSVLAASRSGNTLISHTFGYETATGRMASVTSGSFTATYGYTSGRDLPASVNHAWSGTTKLTRTTGYDAYGRLAHIAQQAGTTTVSAHGTAADPIGYDALGRRTRIAREDGSVWGYGYNSRDEVTSGDKKFSDDKFVPGHRFSYNYDTIGNRTTAARGGDKDGEMMDSISYTANSVNQYSAYSTPSRQWITGEAATNSQVFVNDQWAPRHGNFFAWNVAPDNSAGPVYQPVTIASKLLPTASQSAMLVSSLSGNLLIAPALISPSHDEDGNLTSDGLWNYTWDGENRLIAMESATAVPAAAKRKVTFTYDALSRRIGKQSYTWNSGTSAYVLQTNLTFVYDGWNLLAELDANNGNAVVRSYVWGLDLSRSMQGAGGVGGLLVVTTTGSTAGTYAPAYDSNGNITALVKMQDGTTAATYEYGPFGERLVATGPAAKENPFQFSTKYCDSETGLLYYGYRFYDATTGRWINRDPLEEEGGLNLYLALANNGINKYDPDGRIIETGWDLFNVGTGVISLAANIAAGNYAGAALDAAGLTYDVIATAVPGLPAGASTVIKASRAAKLVTKTIQLAKNGLAGKMASSIVGCTDKLKIIRYAVVKGVDEAHHIIPKGGPPKVFGSELKFAMDCLRSKAKRSGINIENGLENAMSLPKDFHRIKAGNTLNKKYYERVVAYFKDCEKATDFTNKLDELAKLLLKESGKM